MTATPTALLCRTCRQGHLQSATFEEVFHPHGTPVRVELLTSRCDHCGAHTTLARQHDENLRRLAARKPQYGRLLMGEEILALRKKYGLSQQAAARIFGKGKIAFSRYETETSYPDDSTTLLLTLAIERPEILKDLADKAGEIIPLWEQRCEDRRHAQGVISFPTRRVISKKESWPIQPATSAPAASLNQNPVSAWQEAAA